MKIIDFKVYGNAIRFYLGDNDCTNYWGDDWNDTPYEHNAGTVYESFVRGVADVYVDIDLDVLTPADDWAYHGNSPFCKEDFKYSEIPCVIIAKSDWSNSYSKNFANGNGAKIYFNDLMEPGKYFVNKELKMVAF